MQDDIKQPDNSLGKPSRRGRNKAGSGESPAGNSQQPGGTEEPTGGTAGPSTTVEASEPAEQPKQRITGFDGATINPHELPIDSDAGPAKRGRKKGSRNSKKEEATENLSSVLKLERLLSTACLFMANIANTPELKIDDSEAVELADATRELMKHYPVGMSEKSVAWVNFSFAVGGVFGPRVIAIVQKPRALKVAPTVNRTGGVQSVTPIRSNGPATASAATVGFAVPVAKSPAEAQTPSEMFNDFYSDTSGDTD